MTVLESLIKVLEKLPPEKLVEVARFVHQIEPERAAKRLAALESTAGCMADEEGVLFENAVSEEAMRIDSRNWEECHLGYERGRPALSRSAISPCR